MTGGAMVDDDIVIHVKFNFILTVAMKLAHTRRVKSHGGGG